jgi:hypothetical protein
MSDMNKPLTPMRSHQLPRIATLLALVALLALVCLALAGCYYDGVF